MVIPLVAGLFSCWKIPFCVQGLGTLFQLLKPRVLPAEVRASERGSQVSTTVTGLAAEVATTL